MIEALLKRALSPGREVTLHGHAVRLSKAGVSSGGLSGYLGGNQDERGQNRPEKRSTLAEVCL
jgi:hypothetical protein